MKTKINQLTSKGAVFAASFLTLLAVSVFTVTPFAQGAPAMEKIGKEAAARLDSPPIESRPVVLPNEVTVASNYVFATAVNASLTDMSTGTTQILGPNLDDIASPLTNIGFDFYFQGARFTQFGINDNGVVRLGATAQTATPYKPLAQAGISILTAYGADQRTHVGDGKVHFRVDGAAPSRVLIIEWLNNQSNFNTGGTADLTYQVRLYETTGVIECVYGSMTMSTLGAADVNSRDPNIGFSSSNVAGTVGSVAAPQSGAPPPTFDGSSGHGHGQSLHRGCDYGLDLRLSGITQNILRLLLQFPPHRPPSTSPALRKHAMTLNWTDSANETHLRDLSLDRRH